MSVRGPMLMAVMGAVLGGVTAVNAQVESAIGTADSARRQQELRQKAAVSGSSRAAAAEFAPELFAGELEDVGPQSILVFKKPRARYFSGSVDSQLFYTSNSELDENGTGSTLMTHTISLAFAPEAVEFKGGQLSGRMGFRHQFFNYGLVGSQPAPGVADFDSQTVFGDLQYIFKESWAVVVGLEYNRLLDHAPTFSSYREFYRDWVPRYEITKYANLSETKFFTFAYQGYYHLSETPGNPTIAVQDRIEQVAMMAYTHIFGPKTTVQPFYRAVFTHYTHQTDRDDQLHTTGITLFYNLTSWLTARAALTYDLKESDLAIIPDYRKLDFGVGVTASKRF